MTINDPIVIWGLGVATLIAGGMITRLERRVAKNREDIGTINTTLATIMAQQATHEADKELWREMRHDLSELTKLTSRIAGHLNIK